jgi:hypothetical protein
MAPAMLSEACSGNGGGRNKSGERQPAVPAKRARDGERFSPAEYIRAPRLAYASRSCCATRVRCEMRDLLCTNARQQERRASARRGSQWNAPAMSNEPCSGNSGGQNKSGGRQPAVVRNGWRLQCRTNHVRGIAAGKTRAAGVSPPCQRNAHTTGSVFHRLSTFARHGWLTPAAPAARRAFGAKCAICCAQTHVSKSGGR